MSSIRKIKTFLLYGGIDKVSYLKVQNKINRDNYSNLIYITTIAVVYYALYALFGFLFPSIKMKQDTYLIGAIELFVILMLHVNFSKKSILLQKILIMVLEISLLSTSILVSLSDAHDRLSVMLMVMYMIVPILFADVPIKIIILIVFTDILYILFAYKIKDYTIFTIDFINTLTYSSLGLLVGCKITNIRYERYIYEHSVRKLAEERYKISNTDEPTGLLNRRAFYEKTQDIIKNKPSSLCLIMFDVNGLKTTNDQYGHLAGNQIIEGAASCISEVFKNNALVFRYGGDEFVVISFDNENVVSSKFVDFEHELHMWNKNSLYKLTISYGISVWNPEDELDFEKLITQADKAMYMHKEEYYEKSGLQRRL